MDSCKAVTCSHVLSVHQLMDSFDILAEATEGTGDSSNSPGRVLMAVSGKIDHVAAVTSQPDGQIHCFGTESGLRDLQDQS